MSISSHATQASAAGTPGQSPNTSSLPPSRDRSGPGPVPLTARAAHPATSTYSGDATRMSEALVQPASRIPNLLPHERVFPIQIGSELFKLSGASLSSDAPSYFSQYFQCQIKKAEDNGEDVGAAVSTLYIDRDPVTFRDISLHLQGYHVQPANGTHFVRLFADAQFYSLPRLISQLYEESIFMSIGHREFQIPRDIFKDPGNLPNYFSLGFAMFFSSPDDLFPGLDREGLIRPPSIMPPAVPSRSAETFEELLRLLYGYPVHIRDEAHRETLLRDCRYFNFRGLEQKLIPHALTYNQTRQRHDITLRIEDVLKSGISFAFEPTHGEPLAGWVNYARPFLPDKPAELVLEIGGENTKLHFPPPLPPDAASLPGAGKHDYTGVRAEFFRDTKIRMARLCEVLATKLNLPLETQPSGLPAGSNSRSTPLSGSAPFNEDLMSVVLEPETAITLNGRPYLLASEVAADGSSPDVQFLFSRSGPNGREEPSHKRRRMDENASSGSSAVIPASIAGTAWVVRTGQWRLRIRGAKSGKNAAECVLVGVKLDALSSELSRNQQRGFLGG
ncbi:hypothetical protein SEPCBS119000_005291 [Sporothrix epigloea]|uniref:BTB/POZ domain-containing protein n=1 Tax=Sporothrix epigloea TaxID=1892477 RepID=A0ABP0DWT7_9PEZI